MSVARFIRYPIEVNPDTLAQSVYAYIQARSPQWSPNDTELDVWIIQALTALVAENREMISDVSADIYRDFGATMVGLAPIDATPSTITSTWVMINNAGHTIPAGTQVGILDSAGNVIPFETTADVIILAGSTTAAGVTLRSTNPGAETAGLAGAGVALQLLDVLDFVSTVTANSTSTGGVDAESDTDYLNRLVNFITLLSRRPILPNDFAILGRNVAGVYRIVIIDGYNPAAGGSFNNERMITFAALDANGADVSTAVKNAVQTLLDGNREVSFVVNAMSANRTTIDVTFAAKAVSGYDTVDVHDRAILALQSYLNAATWGQDETGDPQSWTDKGFVRFSEIGQVLSNVPGLDYWTTLTMRTGANAFATTDITLAAPASLAIAGVVTGTVT